MEKIDRLGWTAGLAFESYGLTVGVRVNDPAVLDRVCQCLPPGWKPARPRPVRMLFSLRVGGVGPRPGVRNYHLLYRDVEQCGRTLDLDAIFEALENELQLYVGENARQRVFVHAGVVGWRGQAIVIPGRSFSGKSTLVAALLRAGATYYSDEYAVLDRQGRVHPYPRRLALRQPAGQRPRRPRAEELGTTTGAKPLPVGLIALPRYVPGKRWDPRPLSQGQALLELMNNTLCALRKPEAALSVLQRLVQGAPVLKGVRGEADDTAQDLLDRLPEPSPGLTTLLWKTFYQGARSSCYRLLGMKT
jgi:hypothetical protein